VSKFSAEANLSDVKHSFPWELRLSPISRLRKPLNFFVDNPIVLPRGPCACRLTFRYTSPPPFEMGF